MNDEIGTYSFLPWLRQGIANNIKTQDLDNSVKVRASVKISLTLEGKGIGKTKAEPIPKEVALNGAGDIIGIESRAIIKTEPRNWITNFEPNYLPYIEFYDEDFVWRYTPAAPDTALGRLRPWIMLVVLKEGEFTDGKNIAGKPLPYIEVGNAGSVFPPADQLWAWAHVHANEDIVKRDDDVENKDDLDGVLQRFRDLLTRNPDLAYSRIVCPRKLAANTAYHAFLIPVFETGRLAGLGLDIKDTPATKSAWDKDGGQKEFPYYHRWYFRTGTVGDFEYLVRLLEPKPVDSRVGRRDMDVQDPHPGSNISGIKDEKLGDILKLGGALQVPFGTMSMEDKAEVLKYENWDRLDQLEVLSEAQMEALLKKDAVTKLEQADPHTFQKDLTAFVNLADDYIDENKTVAAINANAGVKTKDDDGKIIEDPDPVITPPLYGRWHAMVQRLLEGRDGTLITPRQNWIHELNLDPRWRVAAGLGTKVVQDRQEEFMDAAWGQVGEILEANRRIRLAQLAKETSGVFYRKHVKTTKEKSIEKALAITAPVQKRVLVRGATVYHHVNTSRVPYAVVSAPMRRIIRPHGRLMRLLPFEGNIRPDNLIQRISKEEVFPAPPKKVPETVLTLDDLSKDLKPDNVPDTILDLLSKYPWLQYLPLFLVVMLVIFLFNPSFSGISLSIIAAMIAGSLYLYTSLRKWTRRVQEAESVLEENQTPGAVDKLPNSPDFRITDMREGFTPSRGAADSPEASRFKTALRNTYEFVQLSGQAGAIPKLKELNVKLLVDETIKSINPEITIPRLVLNNIRIPAHIIKLIGEEFKEAMVYPEFNIPMYKPLVDISTELFLPNINCISQNSISLLETNQKFIESYMVGLNHEFARELLWREFPTDRRGSYFRQFWDVTSYLDITESDPEKLREKLRDIPPLHRWSKYSRLGDHDQREQQGDKEEEVVLVIRGELLKKYPTAVIYAHKAKWQMKTSEKLSKLPTEVKFPEDLKDKIRYDASQQFLIFKGVMSEEEKKTLLNLSTDESYRKAIESNFQKGQVKDNEIDNTQERQLVTLEGLTDEELKKNVKTPLYEAKVDPDIYFFGFDLPIKEARGGTGENPGDEPGWFFVIKERSGEPRFGLDINESETIINVWNDLAWGKLGVADDNFITINANTSTIKLDDPHGNPKLQEKYEQYDEDMHLEWNDKMNAAEVAYILYQAPVLVAVHASEMLKNI